MNLSSFHINSPKYISTYNKSAKLKCWLFNHIYHFFFSEGTVRNPAIWLVLSAVHIFLSLPKSTSLPSLPFFINISRFSGWAVFLSEDFGHDLKPLNNLLFLSFLSLKSLWLTEKYWFRNKFVLSKSVFKLVDKLLKNRLSVINCDPAQKILRKLKREVLGYSWINDGIFIHLNLNSLKRFDRSERVCEIFSSTINTLPVSLSKSVQFRHS